MSFGLTRKTDYALVALAVLADQPGPDGAMSARQIAEEHNLPQSLLMNVLKDLHRGGIVCSRRGAGGGYHLCGDACDISILDVIEAIEGPVKMANCCDDDAEEDVGCRSLDKCPITTPMQNFNELVLKFLGRVSLNDLLTMPKTAIELTNRLSGAVK